MKFWVRFAGFFIHLTILIGIVLVALEFSAFSPEFYRKQYSKLNTAEEIGISEEDLQRATETVLAYTKGKVENMDVMVTLHKFNGMGIEPTEAPMYNEREILHMKDVQGLYLGAWRFEKILGLVSLAWLLFLIVAARKLSRFELWQNLRRGFIFSISFFGSVLLVLGIWAAIDFNSFWTNFHKVFFSNDLWLLDYRYDRMIQMVPEPFFMALVSRILILSAVMIIVFSVLTIAGSGRWLKSRQ